MKLFKSQNPWHKVAFPLFYRKYVLYNLRANLYAALLGFKCRKCIVVHMINAQTII